MRWQGSLRAVHGGDVSGKVPLQQFKDKKNLYAVGPVAELDGEITAIAGKIYIARVKDGKVTTDSDLSTSASFLVWSEVGAWQQSVLLGARIENHAQLEKYVFPALLGFPNETEIKNIKTIEFVKTPGFIVTHTIKQNYEQEIQLIPG